MSLTSLSGSFANTYVNDPAPPPGQAPAPGAAGAAAAATSGSGSATDNLKALADYIPGEILTVYIAAVSTITNWKQFDSPTDAADYLKWIFWIALIATPIWVFFSVLLQSNKAPTWKAFLWPMMAGPLAFAAYAFAIPSSWLATSVHNGGLFASLILLICPVALHGVTLVYTKLLPP